MNPTEPKRCPHCKNDDERLIEIIRSDWARCEVCSKMFPWPVPTVGPRTIPDSMP